MIENMESVNHDVSRKRKFTDPSEYKRNQIRKAIIKGEKYVNHKGNETPAKKPSFTCGCKRNCLGEFPEDNVTEIFARFHDLGTKNEQDMLLYGLIDVEEVAIRRPRNANPRINSASFKYHLLIGTSRHIVCLNAFVNAFGVTTKRVRRIRELKKACKTPEDKRGKAVSFSVSDEIKSLVREHISSFPVKESHYLGGTKF
ncbi:uncharacterized protein LOC124366901 [Homalodisca vitripennis]|uniref:uncharacterized protein LOC124366901 n=1 Tax=Homalodisca vitripennis TaxID=197043 RepID=UPI001EEB141C|nr:uncharacterized protein LOC124366901 [Homalodisca vitripennis]